MRWVTDPVTIVLLFFLILFLLLATGILNISFLIKIIGGIVAK